MNINQEIARVKYRLSKLEQQRDEFRSMFLPNNRDNKVDWNYNKNRVDEWRLPNVSNYEVKEWLINLAYGVRSKFVTADELMHKLHSLPTEVHERIMWHASTDGGQCFEDLFSGDSSPVTESAASESNFEIAPKSTEVKTNWYYAKLYCIALNIDGKTGWRMPAKEELNQIYESENDFEKDWYWSSTEAIGEQGHGDYAWYQHFGRYPVPDFYKKSYKRYIRAIRSI
jgi:hypothetical protein